jgi:hypothetical protein
MGMIVRRGENDFEPTPPGLHDAVCVNYFDLGIQHGWQDKLQPKVVLLFELAARMSNGKRFHVSKEFTASLGEMAALRSFLEAWRGRTFTEAELEGFDLDGLIGAPCALNLIDKVKDSGKSFIEVAAVMRLTRGSQPMVSETSRDYVPAWVKRKIDNQIIPGYPSQAQQPAPARPPVHTGTYSPPPGTYGPAPRSAPAQQESFDDSIPF